MKYTLSTYWLNLKCSSCSPNSLDIKDELVVYNPISGVQYKYNPVKNSNSPKVFDLRRFLDMSHQYSKWMIRVNLKTKESLASPKKTCVSTKSATK